MSTAVRGAAFLVVAAVLRPASDRARLHFEQVEGWLRKNHAGGPYLAKSCRRFFVQAGFAVHYYADDKRKKLKGHFDLRNVVSIAPTPEEEADNAVTFRVADEFNAVDSKKLVVSFSPDPAARERWLTTWCSAVVRARVDPALHEYIDDALARKFNLGFGTQPAIGSRRALLGGDAPLVAPLTPRGGEGDGLDTPRVGAAVGSPTVPPPNPAPVTPMQTYEVTVPDGAVEGDKLKMTLPSGVQVLAPTLALLTLALLTLTGRGDKLTMTPPYRVQAILMIPIGAPSGANLTRTLPCLRP